MERALLQGERQAELEQIHTEKEIIIQLQQKLSKLESGIQREKDQVMTLWDTGTHTGTGDTVRHTQVQGDRHRGRHRDTGMLHETRAHSETCNH